MNRIASFAIAAACAVFSAAPVLADVVIERSSTATFTIPDALGMRSVKNTQGPYFSHWLRTQREGGSRRLALMVPLEDAAMVNRGGFPDPMQYALAYTTLETESVTMTAAAFKRVREAAFVAQVEKSEGPSRPPGDAAFEAKLASYLREAGVKPVPPMRDGDPDMDLFLGVHAKGDNYITYGSVSRTHTTVKGKVVEISLVIMTTLMSVSDHMLSLQSIRKLRTRADIEAAKATMQDWVVNVTKANS